MNITNHTTSCSSPSCSSPIGTPIAPSQDNFQRITDVALRALSPGPTDNPQDCAVQALQAWVKECDNSKELSRERCSRMTACDKILRAFQNQEETLSLTNLQLTSLPSCIGQLVHLKTLNLSQNKFTSLPTELQHLAKLENLFLGRNQFSSWPAWIGLLTNLKQLSLAQNQLSSLSAEIEQLARLKNLDLSYNRLTSLPAAIGSLIQLESLHLAHNQLSSLPAEIASLTKLQRLLLFTNRLSSLPTEITSLTNLEKLDLSDNELTTLPDSLLCLPKIATIDAKNNRFSQEEVQALQAAVQKRTSKLTLTIDIYEPSGPESQQLAQLLNGVSNADERLKIQQAVSAISANERDDIIAHVCSLIISTDDADTRVKILHAVQAIPVNARNAVVWCTRQVLFGSMDNVNGIIDTLSAMTTIPIAEMMDATLQAKCIMPFNAPLDQKIDIVRSMANISIHRRKAVRDALAENSDATQVLECLQRHRNEEILIQSVIDNIRNPLQLATLLKVKNLSFFHISAKHNNLFYTIEVMLPYDVTSPPLVAFSERRPPNPKDKYLGDGGYATVRAAMTPDEILKAPSKQSSLVRRVTKMPLQSTEYVQARRLIAILQSLQGKPGVIPLLGVCEYETPLSHKQVIATYYPRYDADLHTVLFGKYEKLTEDQRIDVAGQLLTALAGLPGAHGDLKPENIVLNRDGKMALIDFEFYRSPDEQTFHGKGTLEWMAPECFNPGIKTDTKKLDVWPAGLILYYLFCPSELDANKFYWPWQNTHRQASKRNMIAEVIHKTEISQLLSDPRLSKEKQTLLSHMIDKDLATRWTIDEAAKYFHEHIAPRTISSSTNTP